jgi:hypothetical protein
VHGLIVVIQSRGRLRHLTYPPWTPFVGFSWRNPSVCLLYQIALKLRRFRLHEPMRKCASSYLAGFGQERTAVLERNTCRAPVEILEDVISFCIYFTFSFPITWIGNKSCPLHNQPQHSQRLINSGIGVGDILVIIFFSKLKNWKAKLHYRTFWFAKYKSGNWSGNSSYTDRTVGVHFPAGLFPFTTTSRNASTLTRKYQRRFLCNKVAE